MFWIVRYCRSPESCGRMPQEEADEVLYQICWSYPLHHHQIEYKIIVMLVISVPYLMILIPGSHSLFWGFKLLPLSYLEIKTSLDLHIPHMLSISQNYLIMDFRTNSYHIYCNLAHRGANMVHLACARSSTRSHLSDHAKSWTFAPPSTFVG